jgi:hypothetical protein
MVTLRWTAPAASRFVRAATDLLARKTLPASIDAAGLKAEALP